MAERFPPAEKPMAERFPPAEKPMAERFPPAEKPMAERFPPAEKPMAGKVTAKRFPLAEKAMAESFARLRYKDTSLLIWQQQQEEMEKTPINYLNRSRSAWYSQYGNQAVVVRDRTAIHRNQEHGSRICSVM